MSEIDSLKHDQIDKEIEDMKASLVNVCHDVDNITERILDFTEKQSEIIGTFKDDVFKKLNSMHASMTSKEDLIGALSARVGMMEKRQETYERIERDNARINAELSGAIHSLAEIVERANPVLTRNDVDALGKKVSEHSLAIGEIAKTPGRDAIEKERIVQITKEKIRLAIITACAGGAVSFVISTMLWLLNNKQTP